MGNHQTGSGLPVVVIVRWSIPGKGSCNREAREEQNGLEKTTDSPNGRTRFSIQLAFLLRIFVSRLNGWLEASVVRYGAGVRATTAVPS